MIMNMMIIMIIMMIISQHPHVKKPPVTAANRRDAPRGSDCHLVRRPPGCGDFPEKNTKKTYSLEHVIMFRGF